MKTKPNDPAFNQNAEIGLTKREYFAAMAMQILLSGNNNIGPATCAENAVIYADALIAELNKTPL